MWKLYSATGFKLTLGIVDMKSKFYSKIKGKVGNPGGTYGVGVWAPMRSKWFDSMGSEDLSAAS